MGLHGPTRLRNLALGITILQILHVLYQIIRAAHGSSVSLLPSRFKVHTHDFHFLPLYDSAYERKRGRGRKSRTTMRQSQVLASLNFRSLFLLYLVPLSLSSHPLKRPSLFFPPRLSIFAVFLNCLFLPSFFLLLVFIRAHTHFQLYCVPFCINTLFFAGSSVHCPIKMSFL
jgi:hypothetical protein